MQRVVFPWVIPAKDSLASFQEHLRYMTHISPTWYSMDSNLAISGDVNPKVSEQARQNGCRLVPLIVNEKFRVDVAHAILATAESRKKAAEAIVSLVMDNDFAGINMDFEGPFVADRENYSKFIAEIRRLLPDGKELSVDVVPQIKPPTLTKTPSKEEELDEWVAAWREAFDYKSLGQHVDLFILMGYDYSGRLSPPGPVAPYWWLRKIITYALERVPRGKIVLGLPFYGRHWSIRNGKHTHERPVTMDEGHRLATQEGAKLELDEDSVTNVVRWQEDDREHIAYFDDAETLKRKLDLIREFDLAGAAFWRLGMEEQAVWDKISRLTTED